MKSLPLSLKVVILDKDTTSAKILKAVIETNPDMDEVAVFDQQIDSDIAFRDKNFNCLFIDIFSLGVDTGIDIIDSMRRDHPKFPICLYSSASNLSEMPCVNDYWRIRFGHFYKLAKDQIIQMQDGAVEDVLYSLSRYLQNRLAMAGAEKIRKFTEEMSRFLTPTQKQEIDEASTIIKRSLELQGMSALVAPTITIPGINTQRIEQLVNDTLEDAKHSLHQATHINIGILCLGSLLLLSSFITSLITNRWEPIAFGGFGIAGIIASLITNPLKSIGAGARRIVQVQIAYLSFLSQLAILNQNSSGVALIERSKQMQEVMSRIHKDLCEYFA
jgi:hypothetical protein